MVISNDAQPYENVNTGRNGYEISRNLKLMEESPAPVVAYYSAIPDVVAEYDNITGDEIRPQHWNTGKYNTEDDPYTEIEMEGYINMRGLNEVDESF